MAKFWISKGDMLELYQWMEETILINGKDILEHYWMKETC